MNNTGFKGTVKEFIIIQRNYEVLDELREKLDQFDGVRYRTNGFDKQHNIALQKIYEIIDEIHSDLILQAGSYYRKYKQDRKNIFTPQSFVFGLSGDQNPLPR